MCYLDNTKTVIIILFTKHYKTLTFMKQTFKSILLGLIVFALGVLLNCALIWMGYFGFAILMVLTIFAIAGLIGLDNTQASKMNKLWFVIATAALYLYTIWFPEVWIAAIAGAAIIGGLWKSKDLEIVEYVSTLVLYILTCDIAFYLMGDPILEWVDAVLTATALACCGILIYRENKA